ncbi:hypothetical protein HDU81_006201 [Chytriomyces hyalinus]|nr:hypothetical protein HDU81_006201 [Chytriomyces hyalinus]
MKASTTVRLSQYEQSPFLQSQEAICYATFYTGSPPISHLKARVCEILALNPVLAGRISKRAITGLHIQIPQNDSINVADHFQVLESTISHETNPLGPELPVLVPCNRVVVRTQAPLYKMAVLVNEAKGQFCVAVAISHMIVDGVNFYSLLSMLDKNQAPSALEFNFRHGKEEASLKQSFKTVLPNLHQSMFEIMPTFGQPLQFAVSGIVQRLKAMPSIMKGNEKWRRVDVPAKWIADQKRHAMQNLGETAPDGKPAFVSTNDVLVSWFLRRAGVSTGAMIINLRGKVDGLNENSAGNYMRLLTFQTGQFETPSAIREAISGNAKVLKACPELKRKDARIGFNAKFGIVSNVCALFRIVELPECAFLEHHYTHRDADVLAGIPYCTVYMAAPGKICMLTNVDAEFLPC